jgi:nucleoside-diphosphate-sugar epimerase
MCDAGGVAAIIAASAEAPSARNRVFNVGAETPSSVDYLSTAAAMGMGIAIAPMAGGKAATGRRAA